MFGDPQGASWVDEPSGFANVGQGVLSNVRLEVFEPWPVEHFMIFSEYGG